MPLSVTTVIGDLVGSRQGPRPGGAAALALGEALSEVNATVATVQAFEPTVGDEFQGACPTLADATLATLLVRLALRGRGDARCGIGVGEVTVTTRPAPPCCRTVPAGGRPATPSRRSSRPAAPAGPGTSAPAPPPSTPSCSAATRSSRGSTTAAPGCCGWRCSVTASGRSPSARASTPPRSRAVLPGHRHRPRRAAAPGGRMSLCVWLVVVGLVDLMRAARDARRYDGRCWC